MVVGVGVRGVGGVGGSEEGSEKQEYRP